ncbi:hypothetical protein AVEN_160085-1 [Araneus ventricosus]|uniref:Uncharacterized protein n=1 Tax=Araneus ventricosus TaxID=182803 RepID=A0A4Y2GHW2_ARAVE|nr:hypothetical protein AVEN_160085-1 [Araneus ventricosus]
MRGSSVRLLVNFEAIIKTSFVADNSRCNDLFFLRKLQYKYIMTKREFSGFEQGRKTGWSVIDIYVKNAEVTVIRHVPLYGRGELFSHIGGLLGCWLGVSVFTFTDIIGKVFWKAVSWKMDKIQKSPAAEHLD